MTGVIETKSSIPTGSEFRILLNSAHISYGEVHTALKKKGVYVGNSDKSVTVPILSATLLTPTQFSELIDHSITRESRPKTKVSKLDLVSSDCDWIEPLKLGLFAQGFDPSENMEFINFIASPNIVVHSKDKVTIPYVVNRRDISQDLINRELRFSGEIVIERQGDSLNLEFSSVHSSPQTETINNRITSRISHILNDAGTVKNDTPMKITFGSFSSVERVLFFKRLTTGVSRVLGTGSVNDMDICRDADSPPLPNDPQVSWMNHSVKRLKIDGERLNDIFLISDEEYYPFYHVLKIDITYPYTISANEGTCRIGFSFSNQGRSSAHRDDSELTFEFFLISHNGKVNSDSKKEISSKLVRVVRRLIEEQYEKIVNDRT